MKNYTKSRGWEAFASDNEDEYPEKGQFRDFFVVQMDKITCQSNNRKLWIFDNPGIPTQDVAFRLL